MWKQKTKLDTRAKDFGISIKRKIISTIGLLAIIPCLVTYYLFGGFADFIFFRKGLIVMITAIIGILGVTHLFYFMALLTKLYKALVTVADGNLNHKAEVVASSGTENFALSINQVSRMLRESADELEKRSILIKRATQEMKRMDELKSMYLTDVAHELRAPLINIDKSSVFLLEGKNNIADDEQKNFLQIINDNAKRLIRLVNDLLYISRQDAGELTIHYSVLGIKDLLEEAMRSLESWRRSKELQLELKIAPELPRIYADGDRIIQVIINLLSNAIKFTPAKGKIIVEAKTYNKKHVEAGFIKNPEQAFLMISVRDTGVGIPASQRKTLFVREKFQQEISSYNTLPSTGLGLPIAKQIVEMHGGEIWVESQPGYGSKVTFTIPQGLERKDKTNMRPYFQALDKKGKSILIIDDEKIVRELLAQELGKRGFAVEAACDGLEGLEKALEHGYDLVIADIRMPNIDGISCMSILRKINPKLSFIFVTGFPVEQALEDVLKRNSCLCLKKPFELQELLKTVEESCLVCVKN